jgi:hypothetical protein
MALTSVLGVGESYDERVLTMGESPNLTCTCSADIRSFRLQSHNLNVRLDISYIRASVDAVPSLTIHQADKGHSAAPRDSVKKAEQSWKGVPPWCPGKLAHHFSASF